MDSLVNLVGSNIKKIRKSKDFTQEILAEKCGIQVSYLAGVERGDRNITLESLEKILKGLEVDPYEFFQEDRKIIDKNIQNEQLIILINKLLNRSEKEIYLINRIAQEIFKTY